MNSVVVALRLQSMGSVVVAHRLSCLPPSPSVGMWNLPRVGIKLLSPALANEFFTTGPPRKSCTIISWCLLPCFCITFLPWLVNVWICPLELREGQGGWMKPISYKQEMRDMIRICAREAPQNPACLRAKCFIRQCYQTKLGSAHLCPVKLNYWHGWNRKEWGKSQILKEWHSSRTWHKLIRTK